MINRASLIGLALAAALLPTGYALAHDTGSHAPAGHAMPAAVTVGAIEISGAFSRATLPNAPVAGGYLTITNTGATDDRLVSATSPIAAATQIHQMTVENDVMKMRELGDGIVIPAGQTVTLQPGGLHIMFMKLGGPLVEGTTVPVTLTFETAGTVAVDLAVGGFADDAPTMDHGAHGGDAMSHGDAAAHHGSTAAIDQSGLSDLEAIAAMQKSMFDTPDNPLTMGPIVVSGEFAISDWAQDGAGGRALLRKTASGWGIHLCAGEGLKDAANLVSIGVPEADAHALATQLAEAERTIDPQTIALYDSFNGTMMVDESLI